jgi:hypothetical protein
MLRWTQLLVVREIRTRARLSSHDSSGICTPAVSVAPCTSVEAQYRQGVFKDSLYMLYKLSYHSYM